MATTVIEVLELPHIKSYRRGEAKRSLTHN
jgi:hypothetical protein